jgi:hypothetical protein
MANLLSWDILLSREMLSNAMLSNTCLSNASMFRDLLT